MTEIYLQRLCAHYKGARQRARKTGRGARGLKSLRACACLARVAVGLRWHGAGFKASNPRTERFLPFTHTPRQCLGMNFAQVCSYQYLGLFFCAVLFCSVRFLFLFELVVSLFVVRLFVVSVMRGASVVLGRAVWSIRRRGRRREQDRVLPLRRAQAA